MIELDGFMAAVDAAFHGGGGLTPLLVKYYLSVLLVFWPTLRVIERFGRNFYGALLLFVPLLGFVVLLGWLALKGDSKAGAV